MIRVAVSGYGAMGRMVVDAVTAADGMELVGVVEPLHARDNEGAAPFPIASEPGALFASARPDVVVDFTNAAWTPALVAAALEANVRPVIGTSGIPAGTLELLRAGCAERGLGAVVAANFALGAVVQMHLAQIAARYFDAAEVIELHHDRKVDAPSGTALQTARLMRAARGRDFAHPDPETEHIPGARGAVEGGVAIHSVRLPGLVGHQEIVFGGQGQTLTLRHDTIGRDSYMPGVLLAVREVMRRDSLVEGLDALIGLT